MGRETRMICLTDLVCLSELGEAFAALERARRDRTIARSRLMTLRESLDRVLDEAFRRQSFGPLKGLFRVEEMALAGVRTDGRSPCAGGGSLECRADSPRLRKPSHAVRPVRPSPPELSDGDRPESAGAPGTGMIGPVARF